MFSKLKIVKTLFRSSLSQERLECLLRIIEDGPPFPDYDPSNAIKLWMNEKVRRPNQNQCLGYKQRAGSKRKLVSLSDCSSSDEDGEEQAENISLFDEE